MRETIINSLREQGVSEHLLTQIETFRRKWPLEAEVLGRLQPPEIPFYGAEVFEMAASALLQGENILLSGTKATGKNVLAENLSYLFGRPLYNISFHVNTDSAALIGTDTFRDNEVVLRRGPVYDSAFFGGFAVLDEVNMAKNDAVSVLHAVLDHRRVLEVPGYARLPLHAATRFIGTMNYGYAGTKELNEALVSRFLVIDMPEQTEENLHNVIRDIFPKIKPKAVEQIAGLFLDLQTKAVNHEISTKSLDLRGLIAALHTVEGGLRPALALRMGVVNKTFDVFEREMVGDIVMTRIPDDWTREDIFDA